MAQIWLLERRTLLTLYIHRLLVAVFFIPAIVLKLSINHFCSSVFIVVRY